MMGAGHPPLGFELDTYGAIQPAHYQVDQDYIERKGQPNDIQIWAVGQALDLKKRMDALLDPGNALKGLQPELALFDCQGCHHAMNQLQWRARASTVSRKLCCDRTVCGSFEPGSWNWLTNARMAARRISMTGVTSTKKSGSCASKVEK